MGEIFLIEILRSRPKGLQNTLLQSLKKRYFDNCVSKLQKTAVNYSIEKPMLLNFVDLSATFYPRFSSLHFPLLLGPEAMEFTISTYFNISKDSFTLQIHIYGE